jgi:isopentenyl diphosphate isomerase/L-lactate dehydrogenase-like FMN-dependent dehydrogenase
VFLGRPVLWGLVHSGEEGVCNVLKLLNDELVMAMKLTGAIRVAVSVFSAYMLVLRLLLQCAGD